MNKKFEADSNDDGQWFVFDNEACGCHAGPMDEHKAVSMAIELNNKKLAVRAHHQEEAEQGEL